MLQAECKEEREKASDDEKVCTICGNRVSRLYQHNACKDCLSLSLKKCVNLINEFRGA